MRLREHGNTHARSCDMLDKKIKGKNESRPPPKVNVVSFSSQQIRCAVKRGCIVWLIEGLRCF